MCPAFSRLRLTHLRTARSCSIALGMEDPLPLISMQGYISGSWDSSVGIATGYELGERGSIPGRGKTFFPVQMVQTDSGAHSASYAMCTGVLSSGVKRAGRAHGHSLSSSAEVENR
jgi:hypothetical protein